MFETNIVDKINTQIFCSVTFPPNSCHLLDNVEKYCRVGQATDDNMAHAHCMLDNKGYEHNTGCVLLIAFTTTTIGARTRLNVT